MRTIQERSGLGDLRELAGGLGLSLAAVRHRATRGRLPVPVIQMGSRGRRYYWREDLEAWRRRSVQGTANPDGPDGPVAA